MVYRVFVEKRNGLENEASALASDITSLLQIGGLTRLRLLNRYDVEGVDQALFQRSVNEVFSEPMVDVTFETLEQALAAGSETPPATDAGSESPTAIIAVEPLPGQFDQRADSAAQCIQLDRKSVV